jgi:DNA-binding CsgD family transcriptional regulator
VGQATFGETIDALYRAVAEPQSWSEALEQIADHVGGSGALHVHNDLEQRNGAIVVGRLRDDLSNVYLREYVANPVTLAVVERGRIGRPELASRLVDARTVRHTAYHADILAPQSIVDQIALPLASLSGGTHTGGVGITLNQRQADQARTALDRMARLAPHLARALDLSLGVVQHRNEAGRIDELFDALPGAAMLLDGAGRIIRANVSAEEIIGAGDGIGTRSGMFLIASMPDEDRRLRPAILRALMWRADDDDDNGFGQALSVNRPSGLPPLLVILTPFRPAHYAFLEMIEQGARLLVQIVDPVARLRNRTEPLQQAYALTVAEARIAELIGSGLTAPEAARVLGLSATTVRTHLAHCFDKTGVRSQVSLARLVNAISPRTSGKRL